MSGFRRFSDGGRAEKSNFVQTCNLLSRYMKEKGSIGDLNIGIRGKVENLESIVKPGKAHCSSASSTMNLLADKGKSAHPWIQQQPSMAPIYSINTVEDASYKSTSSPATETNSKHAQLTIFYLGQMLAFDDFPSDKAKELIAFAQKQSSQMSCGILLNTLGEKPSPSTSSAREGLPPRPQASTSPQKACGISSNTCQEKINSLTGGAGRVTPQPEELGSDLPIARRSSLHRFLEKRKARAAARGPYHHEQPPSYSKGDEQLELRL